LIEAGKGRGRVEFVVSRQHLRTYGIAHGGILATLLDTAMGMAAMSVAPPDHDVVTAQLNVNFIRSAWEGERLVTAADVRHSGRRTAVARGEVQTSDGQLVALGSATFLFTPLTDPAHQKPTHGTPS
jgi:acyl-CoA thioesterase